MTSGARSPKYARTSLRVRTAARSGPSPKARVRTVKLAPSSNAIDLILHFKTSKFDAYSSVGAPQSLAI